MEKQLENLTNEIIKLSESISNLWQYLAREEKKPEKKERIRPTPKPMAPHLQQWLLENCEFGDTLETKNTDLYKTYLKWCDSHEIHPTEVVYPMKFGWAIKKQTGVEKVEKKIAGQTILFRKGIGLKSELTQ